MIKFSNPNRSSSNYFAYQQKLVGDSKSQKCKIEIQCNTPMQDVKEQEVAGSSQSCCVNCRSLWQPVQWLAERMMSTSIIRSLQKTYRLTRKLLTCGRINVLTFWLHIVTDSCWKHCATVEPEVTCGQLCYFNAIAFVSWIYYLFRKMELKYFQENLLPPSQDDY